jgi:hypothetical protein
MTKAEAEKIVNAHPKSCYQELNSRFDFDTPEAYSVLCAARQKCGYDCNDDPGCPYSGKVEPYSGKVEP